jgi:hypothetical protein
MSTGAGPTREALGTASGVCSTTVGAVPAIIAACSAAISSGVSVF